MTAFVYPRSPLVRRHGPEGYKRPEGYRPWLRDEFAFRCVYCLFRETWHPTVFHIDHVEPVSVAPDRKCDYENLVYCCARCNLAKGDSVAGDPTQLLLSKSVVVHEDGSVAVPGGAPNSRSVKRLIQALCLNSEQWKQWRRLWRSVIELSAKNDRVLYDQFMGLPKDPPDLQSLRPPDGNKRPDGLTASGA